MDGVGAPGNAMRIVIGEDEVLMRGGLKLVLEGAGFDVVGEAADQAQLWSVTEATRPDLVITDIRMPPTFSDEGLRFALAVRAADPAIAVLVLSQHVQRKYAIDLVGARSGGTGYLLKQRVTNVDKFCRDVYHVGSGGTVLDPEVVSVLMARARRQQLPLERLTTRQTEVLGLMAEGRSNAAIAKLLSISNKAVVQHASHIYDQLDLPPSDDDHRRVLAVVRFLNGASTDATTN